MSNRFSKVPVEHDTKIVHEEIQCVEKYSVLVQLWYCSGISANSVIFVAEDVADLSEQSIINIVRNMPIFKPDSEITFKRNEDGYTFVNFNFIADLD